jgi:hypothetical protein
LRDRDVRKEDGDRAALEPVGFDVSGHLRDRGVHMRPGHAAARCAVGLRLAGRVVRAGRCLERPGRVGSGRKDPVVLKVAEDGPDSDAEAVLEVEVIGDRHRPELVDTEIDRPEAAVDYRILTCVRRVLSLFEEQDVSRGVARECDPRDERLRVLTHVELGADRVRVDCLAVADEEVLHELGDDRPPVACTHKVVLLRGVFLGVRAVGWTLLGSGPLGRRDAHGHNGLWLGRRWRRWRRLGRWFGRRTCRRGCRRLRSLLLLGRRGGLRERERRRAEDEEHENGCELSS